MTDTDTQTSDKLEDNFKLLKQGAEARVYVGEYLGRPAIVKERFVKTYRHPDLDSSITKDRIKNEARAIVRCKSFGVRTPSLYLVDPIRRRIYMEYFTKSYLIKDYFTSFFKTLSPPMKEEAATELCAKVARLIGTTIRRIHDHNIIHGDMTTSNMFLVPYDQRDDVTWINTAILEIAFIDFGLSYVEASQEDKAVDLYVLERALISTHNDLPYLLENITKGYMYNSQDDSVLVKLEEVRARGRKRTMVG